MRLPWCDYPTVAEVGRHGLQALPDELPVADLSRAKPYRSGRCKPTRVAALTPKEQLEMAKVMADAFSRRDPMLRYLQLPQHFPQRLAGYRHSDPLGTHEFGAWRMDTLFAWFVRIFFLTDPTSPASSIRLREDVLQQSLAILDEHGRVIGGAINETLPHGEPPPLRDADPILAAVLEGLGAILGMLIEQDRDAIASLEQCYPAFRRALRDGRVGHHVLIARSDLLPGEDAFELVAGTVEHYGNLGFEYVTTSAVNQWTGAAATVLGGVPVHYEPYLKHKRLPASSVPIETASSPTGFLSDKDSGSMLYVIRIR